jgi:hypothetical protein
MIRIFIAASMVLAATLSASAQPSGAVVNGKTVTFQCALNSKTVEIKVTNPNGVDKKCDMSCTYNAADKKSYEVSCKNIGVFKNADKLVACSEGSPKGGQPFTNFKAQGKCN